jgi:hypothetical protein
MFCRVVRFYFLREISTALLATAFSVASLRRSASSELYSVVEADETYHGKISVLRISPQRKNRPFTKKGKGGPRMKRASQALSSVVARFACSMSLSTRRRASTESSARNIEKLDF